MRVQKLAKFPKHLREEIFEYLGLMEEVVFHWVLYRDRVDFSEPTRFNQFLMSDKVLNQIMVQNHGYNCLEMVSWAYKMGYREKYYSPNIGMTILPLPALLDAFEKKHFTLVDMFRDNDWDNLLKDNTFFKNYAITVPMHSPLLSWDWYNDKKKLEIKQKVFFQTAPLICYMGYVDQFILLIEVLYNYKLPVNFPVLKCIYWIIKGRTWQKMTMKENKGINLEKWINRHTESFLRQEELLKLLKNKMSYNDYLYCLKMHIKINPTLTVNSCYRWKRDTVEPKAFQ